MNKKMVGIIIIGILLALYGYFAFNSYQQDKLALELREKQILEVKKETALAKIKEKEELLQKEKELLKTLEAKRVLKEKEELLQKQREDLEIAKQFTEDTIAKAKSDKIAKLLALKEDSYIFHFDSNSVVLTNTEKLRNFLTALNLLAEENLLKSVSIGAHTDNIGSKSYNLKLSSKRADALKDKLLKYEVKIEINPYGETTPIAPNNTQDGRTLNRRIEVNIY